MFSIAFSPVVLSADYFFPSDGEPPPGQRRGSRGLKWSINVDRSWARQEVRLSTGGTLHDLPGSLHVWEDEYTAKDGTKDDLAHRPVNSNGLHYFPYWSNEWRSDPESYSVELYVSTPVFDRLVRLAELGRPPNVVVTLGYDLDSEIPEGERKGAPVKIGWEPDGSGMDWDNKARPNVKVVWCSFSSAFGTLPQELNEDKDDKKQLAMMGLLPPTRADLVAIQARVEKIDDRLASLTSTVKLLALLIVVVLIAGRLLR